jgi:hypothetical protein
MGLMRAGKLLDEHNLSNGRQYPTLVGVMKRAVWLTVLWLALAIPVQSAVIYVDDDAAAGGSGESWATALTDLQLALDMARAYDEIRVAAGIYHPAVPGGDRTATFSLKSWVAIRGGYAGLTGADTDERDPQRHVSVLSGDLNHDDEPGFINNQENSYHVVTANRVGNGAELDGFTVTAGNADDCTSGTFYCRGAGIYMVASQPTIRSCTISGNTTADEWSMYQPRGGGIYLVTSSDASFIDCVIQGNRSPDHGAGAFINGSSPSFVNTVFADNTTQGLGGGVVLWMSDSVFEGCLLSGNVAGFMGGGIFAWSLSSPTLIDCQLIGNQSLGTVHEGEGKGGALASTDGAAPLLVGCELRENQARTGGAIAALDDTNVTLVDTVLRDNSAVSSGGALSALGDFGSVDFLAVNSLFFGNSAASGGAVFEINDAQTRFANCTLVGNTSSGDDGGALLSLAIGDVETVLYNSILFGNSSPQIIHNGNRMSIAHCCVEGGGNGVEVASSSVLEWAAGNLEDDPGFLDSDAFDYRLSPDSPCIDSGSNWLVPEGVVTDISGLPRFLEDPDTPDCPQPEADCGRAPIVDMGAHELVPPLPVRRPTGRARSAE